MISIRPYQLEDAPRLFQAVIESKPNLMPWLPWCHEGYSLAEAEAWVALRAPAFAEGREYSFAIWDDDLYLGGCGLNRIDVQDRCANLGYWVRTAKTRRGVATSAVHQLVPWAWANTTLARLEVLVAVGNLASQRVAEKSGAVREGIARQRIQLAGRSHDCVVYSFVRP